MNKFSSVMDKKEKGGFIAGFSSPLYKYFFLFQKPFHSNLQSKSQTKNHFPMLMRITRHTHNQKSEGCQPNLWQQTICDTSPITGYLLRHFIFFHSVFIFRLGEALAWKIIIIRIITVFCWRAFSHTGWSKPDNLPQISLRFNQKQEN